eukprot:gnl/MRDRNA2_/MRDRNA2_78614_c0_seq1.p1 gnl/MRDRNA2_/MRDRNA2_78614_c0~~gnl/MRDRNA2_/MRDRNA2_78614_c0_seq1.p1  ORF type:complete len:340 (+),score=44.85 gnl/MRDRNA2_/MRDRNA2_78614_c0_seq1:631-1650(+)
MDSSNRWRVQFEDGEKKDLKIQNITLLEAVERAIDKEIKKQHKTAKQQQRTVLRQSVSQKSAELGAKVPLFGTKVIYSRRIPVAKTLNKRKAEPFKPSTQNLFQTEPPPWTSRANLDGANLNDLLKKANQEFRTATREFRQRPLIRKVRRFPNSSGAKLRHKAIECFVCGEVFTSYDKLHEHKRIEHSVPRAAPSKLLQCFICDEFFGSRELLHAHKKAMHAAPKPTPSKMRALCRFFATAQGCRKGESCPFVHTSKGFKTSGQKRPRESTTNIPSPGDSRKSKEPKPEKSAPPIPPTPDFLKNKPKQPGTPAFPCTPACPGTPRPKCFAKAQAKPTTL